MQLLQTVKKEKKPHKSHMSIIQYYLFKREEQLHPDCSNKVCQKQNEVSFSTLKLK